MKNYFLAIFPNQEVNHNIRKTVGEVGRVFDGQEISVRWNKPENYHITLVHLGNNINILKKYLIINRLKNFKINQFTISVDKCALGISRKYKELVYLTIDKGGEELRKYVFQLRNILKVGDEGQFIPHISLGRVSKDLTEQEYMNLNADIRNTNKKLNISDVDFIPTEYCLVESNEGVYSVLKKFSI